MLTQWPNQLAGRRRAVDRHLPALRAIAIGVTAAYLLSQVATVVSTLTVAIVLGLVTRNARLLGPQTRAGLGATTKRLLRAGVVLLGLQLSVPRLLELRAADLLIIVTTVVVTFAGTLWFGRWLKIRPNQALLLATGFSICGASAVAAMGSVTDADDEDIASAIALVTLYGTVAIAVFPLLQGPLSDQEFGIWVGASVHEVAQVVAAAAIVGEAALIVAVLAKLGRVVLLAPLVTVVSIRRRVLRADQTRPATRTPLVPLFVLGFLTMVGIRSLGLLPEPVLDGAATATTLLLAGAMFGLGASVHLPSLIRTGRRQAIVGAVATALAAGCAYGLLLLTR